MLALCRPDLYKFVLNLKSFCMKQLYSVLLMLLPVFAFCQQDSITAAATKQKPAEKPHHSLGLGIKAGLNFTNITSASSVSNSSETGYQVGLFLDPSSNSILGSRTELLYSHQA